MRDDNKLNLGMRCIKYMLIVINLMFLLTSALLIMVGSTIKLIYADFDNFLNGKFPPVPALLVAIGAMMLLVALFGIFGAHRESVLLTNIYAVLLFLVFILEVSAAIAAFVMQADIRDMLDGTIRSSLYYYSTGQSTVVNAVDFMQINLRCCGVDSPRDWAGLLTMDSNDTTIVVPNSCCATYECDEYFTEGCLNQMHFIIAQSTMMLATAATTVAFVQILGVVCAIMLAKTIRRTKSLRAARRWQLQQSLGIVARPDYDEYTPIDKPIVRNENTYTGRQL